MVFPTFAAWAATYGKVYNGDEAVTREAIFNANIEEIIAHNDLNLSWTMGVNQFTDLTEEEFIATYTGEKPGEDFPHIAEEEDVTEVPDAIDWTTQGAVNDITDQKSCGSCWAFSATATLESSYQLATGHLYKLAEQQLVDCDTHNNGCNGGSRDTALKYWEGGACSRASYAYTAKGGTCKASSCTKQVPSGAVTGVVDVTTKSPSALKTAVAGRPVSISVNAGKLKAYANGVVHNDCNKMSHNHAIVTVGYGTDNGDAYFKVRNSWGTGWGEKGYIRLAQQGGTYGTACMLGSSPSYPKISAEVTI
jgi:cathepsin L